MFNVTLVTLASIVTVGIMELLKVYLPENTSGKIKGIISLVLSALIGCGLGFIMKVDVTDIIVNAFITIGLVQFSYDFILKLLKEKIEEIKYGLIQRKAELPLFQAQIKAELDEMMKTDDVKEATE